MYLILENEAEFSVFQLPFDVFSKCPQTFLLIDSNVIVWTHIAKTEIASRVAVAIATLVSEQYFGSRSSVLLIRRDRS